MARWPAATSFIFYLIFCSFLSSTRGATSPSTDTPVPPLQWIQLNTSGTTLPGLKYPSIGYDSTTGFLLIFGGESNGVPQQETYLLNVTSLSWAKASSSTSQTTKPPPRSMAISGGDFAASNRHGHVVIGGKGTNGEPLSDAWEFDYNNQFWSNITISSGGPSARYSASGGIDATAASVQDPVVAGPNNTFYLSGGFDGQNALPLSDVWKFEVAGVLSANNADDVVGSWTQITFSEEIPSRVHQGGTVMPSAKVVAFGGCTSDDVGDYNCAQQDGFILDINATTDIVAAGCPAPRVGPVVVPNYNTFSQSFATQAYMFLGIYDTSLWDDDNGLNQGEVDILNIENGVWTRVLPSGDNSTGTVKFPGPRDGAVAFSSAHALVGSNPSVGSDILVFGGQDANGNYLNELWLLRAYSASLSESNATWSGFGDGVLGGGADASGAGVTIQYISSCAQQLSPSSTSSVPNPTSSSNPSNGSNNASQVKFPYNTKTSHKILSPLSLAGLLMALVFYRLSMPLPVEGTSVPAGPKFGLLVTAGFIALIAYAIGIAGLVLSFTTISLNESANALRKRSDSQSLNLKTSHGVAALVIFIVLYASLPLLLFLSFNQNRKQKDKQILPYSENGEEQARKDSTETGFSALMTPAREKQFISHRATSSSPDIISHATVPDSPIREPRVRVRSLFNGNFWPNRKERTSFDDRTQESLSSAGPSRSFEVMNRGPRTRRFSMGLQGYSSEGGHSAQPSVPRGLSDLDWLDRRQNVSAFGDLDYALTQLNRARAATPASMNPLITPSRPQPVLPSKFLSFLHLFIHAAILGLCVVVLVALWQRAPLAAFIVFLLWVSAFYCIIFFLAWRGTPRSSILAVLLTTLRYHNEHSQDAVTHSGSSSRPLSTHDPITFSSESRSPYIHQPTFRRPLSTHEDELISSNGHARSDDDDEDEETTQRRIEQEMDRRDVSIVTVPKRRLWIANPS